MNRLQYENSPYLLQHAHNPVDWYAYKPEAFERAQAEDKPIIISIGYSTCHWCHVMERESFEDEQTAAYMNAHFVNIKVDREERPDVDHIYMEACQAISGSGGWPLNAFLLPDGRPFFAGTYYPPKPVRGLPSWRQLLEHLHQKYVEERPVVEEQANRLVDFIKNADSGLIKSPIKLEGTDQHTEEVYQAAYQRLQSRFDLENGGFKGAPKFPSTMAMEYLLQYYHYTREEEALIHVKRTLHRMIHAGIYDQIGGGFSRYAVDQAWQIPHFEKMLYDNALLVGLMAKTWKLTQEPLLEKTIEETLAFIEREWQHPDGGFYSALDADSEGEEGKFYLWTFDAFQKLLKEDADWAARFFHVLPEGNWEGKNILHRRVPDAAFAKAEGWSADFFEEKLEKVKATLLEHRENRVRPGLDDKVLLNWNALMITAYIEAFLAFGKDKYLDTAKRALDFLLDVLKVEDGKLPLYRTYKSTADGGQAQYTALLSDYAFLIQALLKMHEGTQEGVYLQQARAYTDYVLLHFYDSSNGYFFFTSQAQTDLVLRKKELYDNAIPSGNSTMAENLMRLSILFDVPDYREKALRMLEGIQQTISQYPSSFGRWLQIGWQEAKGWNEVAIVGAKYLEYSQKLKQYFIPGTILMGALKSDPSFPLLVGKSTGQETRIYVCSNYVCQQPVNTIEKALRQLS